VGIPHFFRDDDSDFWFEFSEGKTFTRRVVPDGTRCRATINVAPIPFSTNGRSMLRPYEVFGMRKVGNDKPCP
jgi:hypothetical protein